MKLEEVLDRVNSAHAEGISLVPSSIGCSDYLDAYIASDRYFTCWRDCVNTAGIDYDQIVKDIIVGPGNKKRQRGSLNSREKILREIRSADAFGYSLDRRGIINTPYHSIYAAACEFFESWKSAVAEVKPEAIAVKKVKIERKNIETIINPGDISFDGLEDAQLVGLSLNGSPQAYDVLVNKYRYQLTGSLINKYRLSQTFAEEIVQESFLLAWMHLGSFRGDSSFQAWLFTISRNKTIDFIRREKLRTMVSENEEVNGLEKTKLADCFVHPDLSSEKKLLEEERQAYIRSQLPGLPAYQREVLELRYFEELGYKEIAERLVIPEGTVMSRLFYARNNLQRIIEKDSSFTGFI